MSGNSWQAHEGQVNVAELTKDIRMEALELMGFSQLAVPPSGGHLGKGSGDTVDYTYFPALPDNGGPIQETERMPETSANPVKVSRKILEYGMSQKWTRTYKEFVRLTAEDAFVQQLKDHYMKTVNRAVRNAAAESKWKVTLKAGAFEFVTNGTPTETQDAEANFAGLRYLAKEAKKRKIPFWDGESYMYITAGDSADALRFDSTISTMLREDSGRDSLNGEIGRVANCRLIEDFHAAEKNPSVTYDEGFLFGADAIVNEVACPVEMLDDTREDFGRQIALAYRSLEVYFKVLSQDEHGQEHIIHVTSDS